MNFQKKQIKMNKSEMDLVSYLLEKTGTFSKDCFEYKNKIIFLVNKEDVRKVIGDSGRKTKSIAISLKKKIDIVAFSSDFDSFVKNIFYPVSVRKINLKNGRLEVFVDKKEVGRAIGKEGWFLDRAKAILSRHFDGVQSIKIIGEKRQNSSDKHDN